MDHYDSHEIAERYHSTFSEGIESPAMINKAIERFSKFLRYVKKSGHILDAGCGTGRFVKYFEERGYKVTGIDTSSSMLEIAISENPNAEFFKMDMRELNFPPSQFDGIWNTASILHLDEKGVIATFAESRRVLKQGGSLFVATRTKEEDMVALEESLEGGQMVVHYYAPNKLRQLLEESDFEISEFNVEQDDLGRPFEYCYIYALNKK